MTKWVSINLLIICSATSGSLGMVVKAASLFIQTLSYLKQNTNNASFPSKFLNLCSNTYISRDGASQGAHFFPTKLFCTEMHLVCNYFTVYFLKL